LIDFYNDYINAFEALNLKEYYEDADTALLVHTGDFANFPSPKENELIPPVKEMFDDIRIRHLETFDRKFADISEKLAVPGNHDADRDADEKERFAHFCTALRHWRWKTVFDTPVVGYQNANLGDKQVAVYLFNSVSATKDESGQLHPEIKIELDKAPKNLPEKHYFRIALLHHNLLPHYGQNVTGKVLVNSGDFNTYLGDNNFKLVLSGHQHLGNEMLFAVPTCLEGRKDARPTLESVFLTLAAPSFLREERGVLPGFNVLQVEILNDSNFVTITLHKFRYSREGHHGAGRLLKPDTIIFQLLVPRIDTGLKPKLPPGEQDRRIRVARKVVDRFYESEYDDVTHIEQLVLPSARPAHFQTVRRELQLCQQIPSNIAALYSTAVLPASHWWQGESAFRRLFIENVGRAAVRTKVQEGRPIYSFYFSDPLIAGIRQARENGQIVTVAHRLRSTKREIRRWCESRLEWDAHNDFSISVWELEDYTHANESLTRRILVKPTEKDKSTEKEKPTEKEIARSIPEWDGHNSPETLEIARIVIWPPDYFQNPDAGRLIELHEDCLIPLFWLSPEKLVSSRDREGNRQPRKRWGYDLIYARKYPGRADPEFPLRHVNDENGAVAIPTQSLGRDAWANDLWGVNGAPAYFRKHEAHLSAEFSVLLRRSDILFAVDAYALYHAGALDEATPTLTRRHDDDTWLQNAGMAAG
jgi:hypothetical protein